MFNSSVLASAEESMTHAFENGEVVTVGVGINAPKPNLEFVGIVKVRGVAVNTILFSELKTACVVKVEASIIAGSGVNQRREIPHWITYVGCEAGKGFFELNATIYRE